MSLGPGVRLGPYEIVAAIGAGGMGEVYRARDTKLGRDVALKVLPEGVGTDPERLARFHREAQVLASLNHPHIGAIHGFEDSGDTHALVLELVEGETLADRVARGPVPVDETLAVAKQIAEALEAAHEQGIIHRDLKPANVKIRPDGRVKVLDFGLAKLAGPPEGGPYVPSGGAGGSRPDVSVSPTITSPAMTGIGMLLGTAAYMAPEQVKGRPATKQSDIWAFGCVLYEMLTGRRAFDGEDMPEILGSVMKTEPDWTRLPGEVPATLRTLLARCLRKDIARRYRDAGDLVIECEEALARPVAEAIALPPRTRVLRRLLLACGIGVLAGALIAGAAVWNLKPAPPVPVSRFRMMLAPGQRLTGLDLTALDFSPDGRHFVYVATTGREAQLYLGETDSIDAKPIAGTDGGAYPFFSPDGQWVGFFTADALKKVAITGGPPMRLATVINFGRGATWSPDGTIAFAPRYDDGLSTLSQNGGALRVLTQLDRQKGEGSHRFPHYLPGGNAVLLTVGTGGSWDDARIDVLKVDTGERKVLIAGGSDARYVPTGHVVYQRAGALMAVPFDLGRLTVTGSPVVLIDGLLQSTNNTGSAQAAFSAAGSLLYVPGTRGSSDRTLQWVDRSGAEQRLPLPPRSYRHPRISPDGRRIVLDVDEGNRSDVWVYDVERETLTRLTFEGTSQGAFWTPDGKRVTFTSANGPVPNLFWKAADGSGAVERLDEAADSALPGGDWSPDGDTVVFTDVDPVAGSDVLALSLKNGRKAIPLVHTPFNEGAATISPDGRWVAFQSNESGRNEIYVQPFPGPGSKVLVSTDGGSEPAWSGDGRELFYRNGDRMMVVMVAVQPTFRASRPEALFEKPAWALPGTRNYDVTRDGRRFLMIKESDQVVDATHINIVLNWFNELKARVPLN